MIDAFPLQWPAGWKRMGGKQNARFDTSFAHSRDELIRELRLFGGKNVIISSNIPLRRDGLPYANQRQPVDPGVVVYFVLDGSNECFPCDRWNRVEDNIHAIQLSIAALRGIERWGSGDMVKAAFRGFAALPEHTHEDTVTPIQRIDYFIGCKTGDEIRARRRNLARDLHPDKGGDSEEFQEMMRQFDLKMKNSEYNTR